MMKSLRFGKMTLMFKSTTNITILITNPGRSNSLPTIQRKNNFKNMKTIEIKNRWSGSIIKSVEVKDDADLSGANLSYANLSYANLSYANLSGANLSYANLSGANLSYANLSGANLSGANLSDANLSGANLRRANLSDANLSGANLSYANLSYANLSGANLSGANLRRANLSGANLSDANLSEIHLSESTGFLLSQCPAEGSFVGWKIAHGLIVKLQICEDAKRSSATTLKCRCSKALVLAIENKDGSKSELTEVSSNHDSQFMYKVGEIVEVSDFDENRFNECSTGIHFFIAREMAVQYN
jgi:uncharacterized protein YjbI with pentapeptide repeats